MASPEPLRPFSSPGPAFPEWLPLDDIRVASDLRFGGKAAMLARMRDEGLRVLPGIAVSAEVYERALVWSGVTTAAARLWRLDGADPHLRKEAEGLASEIHRRLATLDLSNLVDTVIDALGRDGAVEPDLIVRSSGTGEDSSLLSYAGQFASKRCEAGDLAAAITTVWASCTAPHVVAYRAAMGTDGSAAAAAREPLKMGLVIQPYRHFSLAGVLFTQHPTVPIRGWSLIEYLDDEPARLVSGEILPHRCRVNPTSGKIVWERRIEGHPVLPEGQLLELISGANSLRRLTDSDVDVEWGVLDGSACFLQARPATTRPGSS